MKHSTLTIAGIELDIFTQDTSDLTLPVLVLFVIPHRTAVRARYHAFAQCALDVAHRNASEGREAKRDLMVVVLVSVQLRTGCLVN